MVKRFIEWVEDFWDLVYIYWLPLVGIIIGVVVAIIFGINSFNHTDRVPATADDYEPLEQKIVAIQEVLFSTDCDANVKDNDIMITLENSKCRLTAKLESTSNVLNIEHQDKSYTFWGAIIVALLTGVSEGIKTCFATWFVLWILYFLLGG